MNWFSMIEEFNSPTTWGWTCFASLLSLLLIFICHSLTHFSSSSNPITTPNRSLENQGIKDKEEEIVTGDDLKFLVRNLDDDNGLNENSDEKWDDVIRKSNNKLSYFAKCCKPKNAPVKYLSVTVFEDCSPEVLRDFYMDNEYRKQWDKMILQHEQLHVDTSNGTEIGRTIKKFPLFTPREYVLAWRLWEGRDKIFYCFIKNCEHSLAPQQRKYVRVQFFRSGWRIRKVPGRNACEIKMFHQEDAGLNVEMAKLAFAKGIWSYVCKMEKALRGYSIIAQPQIGLGDTAVSLIQKVPPELETTDTDVPTEAKVGNESVSGRTDKKLLRRPSGKVVANGLLLLGGIICLSRVHSSLGAKVAVAYALTKLRKGNGSPKQRAESGEL